MCGRYALHSLIEELQQHFNLFDGVEFRPRWNIVPSLPLPVVRDDGSGRRLAMCRWGLVPGWMKTLPKTRPINARAETVAQKPSFRTAFRRRRCLVPANGYYEWQRQGSIKQPYYISPDNSNLMAFAGLWDRRESGDEPMETFTIITTAANDATRPVHDRMPVILDPSHYELWLEKGDSSLLRPFDGPLRVWPVSRRVNSPANDGADLTAPLSAAEPAAGR